MYLKSKTIKILHDVAGKPFVVDACQSDGDEHTLSTWDWMKEERANHGDMSSWEDMFGEAEIDEGWYLVGVEYDGMFEDPKESYKLILRKIDDIERY